MTEEQRKKLIEQGKLVDAYGRSINRNGKTIETAEEVQYKENRKKLIKQGKLVDIYGEKVEKGNYKEEKNYSRRKKISIGIIIIMIWNAFAIWTWLVHFGYWQKIVEFLSPYIQQFQVMIGS